MLFPSGMCVSYRLRRVLPVRSRAHLNGLGLFYVIFPDRYVHAVSRHETWTILVAEAWKSGNASRASIVLDMGRKSCCVGDAALLSFEPLLLADTGARRLPGIDTCMLVVAGRGTGPDVCARLCAEGPFQRRVPLPLEVGHKLEFGIQSSRAVRKIEQTVQYGDFTFCCWVNRRKS